MGDNDLTNVLVGYANTSVDLPSGDIETGTEKNVKVVIKNNSDVEVTIKIGVRGGLPTNAVEDIILEEGEYRITEVMDEVVNVGGSDAYRKSIINSLSYTTLGLTENSTWEEITKAINDGFDEAFLYSPGNEHWFTTGGWVGSVSGNAALTFTKNNEKMYWYANPNSNTGTSGSFKMNKYIDFTPYSTLNVTGYFKRTTPNTASCSHFTSHIIRLVNESGTVVKTLQTLGPNETLRDPVWDVSDVNQKVMFEVYTSQVVSGYNNTIEITRMWLE